MSSPALLWELVKKNNCYISKNLNRTVWSKEECNVRCSRPDGDERRIKVESEERQAAEDGTRRQTHSKTLRRARGCRLAFYLTVDAVFWVVHIAFKLVSRTLGHRNGRFLQPLPRLLCFSLCSLESTTVDRKALVQVLWTRQQGFQCRSDREGWCCHHHAGCQEERHQVAEDPGEEERQARCPRCRSRRCPRQARSGQGCEGQGQRSGPRHPLQEGQRVIDGVIFIVKFIAHGLGPTRPEWTATTPPVIFS